MKNALISILSLSLLVSTAKAQELRLPAPATASTPPVVSPPAKRGAIDLTPQVDGSEPEPYPRVMVTSGGTERNRVVTFAIQTDPKSYLFLTFVVKMEWPIGRTSFLTAVAFEGSGKRMIKPEDAKWLNLVCEDERFDYLAPLPGCGCAWTVEQGPQARLVIYKGHVQQITDKRDRYDDIPGFVGTCGVVLMDVDH